MKKCRTCPSRVTTKYCLSLICDDPDSIDEGQHAADVEGLHLCDQCAAKLGDGLLEWPRLMRPEIKVRIAE